MPEYQEPIITRTADIVVRSVTKNSDGYLIVTDEGDKEHKISPKRDRLFPFFGAGKAIHLSYAEYKGVEYIVNATPLEQMIKTAEKAPESQTTSVKTATQAKIPEKGKIIPNEGKNRAFALSYAKDLCVAGKIEVMEVISLATVYDMYLSGEFKESESDLIAKYLAKYGKKGGK